jgi:hypothetical protein
MAKKNDASPATKADIKMLPGSIGKLYDANERWKNKLRDESKRTKVEMKAHVDLKIELLRHDLLDARKDRVEKHEDRFMKLERHTGLAVA